MSSWLRYCGEGTTHEAPFHLPLLPWADQTAQAGEVRSMEADLFPAMQLAGFLSQTRPALGTGVGQALRELGEK